MSGKTRLFCPSDALEWPWPLTSPRGTYEKQAYFLIQEDFPCFVVVKKPTEKVTSAAIQTCSLPEGTPDFLVPGTKTELAIRVGFVSLWFAASLVLAIKIPNIGQVIKLLGSLAAVFIFVFPGLCLFKITYRSDPSLTRKSTMLKVIASFAFLAFGAFIFGVVLTQSIQNIIQADSSDASDIKQPFALMIRKQVCDV